MPQGNVTQASGHSYTTSATGIKYRTTNSGNPLAHNDVDANFELLRSAVNGLVSDHASQASDLTTLSSSIGSNDTDIASNASNITALQTSVSSITSGSTAFPISQITGLSTALDGKVDDSQVLTNVPASALFTDTVYSLPVAGTAIGGVKEGGDIDIDADGNMTLKSSGSTINSPGWANPSANNLVQSGTTGTTNITFDVTTKGAPSTATWGIFTIDHTGSSLPGLEVRVWATNSFSGGGAKVFKNNSDKSQDIAGQFFCPIVSSNCRIRVIIWSPDPDQFHVHFMGWI